MPSIARNDAGSVAVTFAVTSLVLLSAIGLGVIAVDVQWTRTRAQAALDAGVLAATAAQPVMTDDQRIALAKVVFDANYKIVDPTKTTIQVVGQPNAVFSTSETMVYGNVSVQRANPFAKLFGADFISIPVASAAKKQQGQPICVLGLDPTEAATMDFNGKAGLDVINCATLANSTDGSGLHQVGQPSMKATEIGVTGGFVGTGYQPQPIVGVYPLVDPLATLPEPTTGACHPLSGAKLQQTTLTLTPGTYCGGLDIKASSTIQLDPGVYIMKDGPLQINSGGVVTGSEVMIAFLGATSTLYMDGDASLSVTSPTIGTYKNIQFFGDRTTYPGPGANGANGSNLWFTVIGNSTLTYDGILYAPSMHVWMAGSSIIRGKSPSYVAIAKKLWFQDNTEVQFTQVNDRGLDVPASALLSRGATLFQ